MTANPMHNSIPQVYMVAVLRYADKSVVAVYSASKEVTKEGIRECVAGNAKIQSGRRYTVEGESQAIHYTLDPQGRVYALVTNPKYSPRVAFIALDELQKQFGKEFGPRVASASEETLNKPARVLLKEISDRFANPSNEDKLAAVQQKIDVVKSSMQDNIQQLLQNEEKLERIEEVSDALKTKSIAFQKGSKELSDKMFWKMWKMRLLIGGLVVAILIIIIVPTAVSMTPSKN